MTQGDLDVAVEAAKKAIDPKLTGLARAYRGTIFDVLPDLCRDVVEAVDEHRRQREPRK